MDEVTPTFETMWADWVVRYNRRGFLMAMVFVWIGVSLSLFYEFNTAPEELATTFAMIRGAYLLATIPALAVAFIPKWFKRLHIVIPFVLLLLMQLNTIFVCFKWSGIASPYFADFALTMLVATLLFVWPSKLIWVAYPLFCLLYVGILLPGTSPADMEQAQVSIFFVLTTGFFSIVMHRVRHHDGVERTKAMAELAELRAIADADRIKVEHMSQELQKLSLMDSLTQVANRRGFDQEMEQAWKDHKTSGLPLSILFCDVDLFKSFNDTYGHQKGDDCLKRIAGALQATAYRSADVVARYGGEEFTVLLPEVPLDIAMRVADRMRIEVEKLAIPHSSSKVEKVVTISIGVASTEMEIRSSKLLIGEADTALYRAKKRGRNCIALPADNTLINRL